MIVGSYRRKKAVGSAAWMVCAVWLAAPANAMVRGDTGTPEVMAKHLKAEEQRVVALANRENLYDDQVSFYATVFTCSISGSHGYIIEYDKPLGQRPNSAKVVARIQNCRVSNIASEQTGMVFSPPVSDKMTVREKCDELLEANQASSCGTYENAMKSMARMGEKIAFFGQNSNATNRDEFYTQGYLTLSASSDGKRQAGLYYTTEEGATIIYGTYRNFNYSAEQQDMFDEDL